MSEQTIIVQTMSDWDKVIQALSPKLKGKNLFLLEGDLGAGKTTLVSLIAKKMNVPLVSSPTFSLIQQYKNIIHVDLYRLEDMEEIDATGFWEIFEDESAIIFVEWSSKISDDLWPLDWDLTKISISKKSENERLISIEDMV